MAELVLIAGARAKRRAQHRVRAYLPDRHPMLETGAPMERARRLHYERTRSDVFHDPTVLLQPDFLDSIARYDWYSQLWSEIVVRWVMNDEERATMRDRFKRASHHTLRRWEFYGLCATFSQMLRDGLVCADGQMTDGYDSRVFTSAAHVALREQYSEELKHGLVAQFIGRVNKLHSKVPANRSKHQPSKKARQAGW